MSEKTAIILFNLGGPDSPEAVQPFLRNLFSDPDIFRFPLPFVTQRLFAWLVSTRRAPEARKNYDQIGGRSPLLDRTNEQAIALQLALTEAGAGHFDSFVCMRYWHPMTAEVVNKLRQGGYQRVILLPLYPQYSTTTTGSSFNEFTRECQRQGYRPKRIEIRQWYDHDKYLRAIIDSIETELKTLPDTDPEKTYILFSAHGLPKKVVERGDPYQQQIEATYESLKTRLGWPHTGLSYQSRVGPLEWLQPYTEDVIPELGNAGWRQLLVYPIAFVSDHIETLQELGIEYRHLAESHGITSYRVARALNDHPMLIETLRDLVLEADAAQ
ncbi:MAG: ferrochelatase [Gammaproteobacteria bacterium]|nr:ferrochelatase [Gammaproteobacteria bacterium]